jgi:uncharacterized protein YndB with AHSA1/START domain
MTKPLIEVETLVDADAATLWQVLTQKKTSAMFMGADVDTDWREGSPIRFTGNFKGKPFRDHGEIRAAEPGRHLAFTHFSGSSGKADVPENYNLVDIRLEPEGERTRVILAQTPQGNHKPDAETAAQFRKNWEAMLGALKKSAAEKAPAAG